jgi:hypothetical protein
MPKRDTHRRKHMQSSSRRTVGWQLATVVGAIYFDRGSALRVETVRNSRCLSDLSIYLSINVFGLCGCAYTYQNLLLDAWFL